MKKIVLMTLPLLICKLAFADVAKIKKINFVQDGEVSKLIIDYDGDVTANRTHLKSDKQILLDLGNVVADKRQMRGIDTSEFSGASVYISPYKKPGSKNEIRFAIQLRDNVRSFLEQKKNRTILHVESRFGVFSALKLKKVAKNEVSSTDLTDNSKAKILIPKSTNVQDILDNLTQSGVKRYVGRKISINVNKATYPEILKMIGDTSGFNIILGSDVESIPPLTINLTNLPWDEVLDTVMKLGDLVAFKHGNILTIKTAEIARADRKKSLDQKNATKKLEPLVTKIFPISYSALTDITKVLDEYKTKDRGSIVSDARTQNLIVKDTVDVIDRMKKIIETLDTQTPQILITSKIIEAEETYNFKAGLAGNGISFGYDPFAQSGAANAGSLAFNSITSTGGATALKASISVLKRIKDLTFELELLESESKVKIISSPKIVTENNKPATISTSNSKSFEIRTATGPDSESTLEKIAIETSLSVTPKVTNEGSILLNLAIQKSGFGPVENGSQLPPTTSNVINTNVLVNNGSTVVVGGVYSTSQEETVSGIPFLKDLPILGWLFRSAYNPQKNRRELIVFITPRIINQEEAGLASKEFGQNDI